jgi:hypothetical protein
MVHRSAWRWGLLIVGIGLLAATPLQAQPCTAGCRSDQIQFTPGDPLTIEVVNRSRYLMQVEQLPLTPATTLLPGQTARLGFDWGTSPNVAIRFWNEQAEPVRAELFRPGDRSLRVELRDLPWQLGDRALYVQNDGRVIVY